MTSNRDWVADIANRVESRNPDSAITVASGLSPSGPIHLGNLREVLTGHFVAEELRSRGREVRHLLSWDDFDRFRRVPIADGVDESWAPHIGRPLVDVPAPHGSSSDNWAEHYRSQLIDSLIELGVTDVEHLSQSQHYRSGVYRDAILNAMNQRRAIAGILAQFQTKGTRLDPNTYFPLRPYCAACGRDTTTVTSFNEAWSTIENAVAYTCACHYNDVQTIANIDGKLVWKVDWAMRWAHESVDFEPAGADHMTPGSSWDAGRAIVGLFGGQQPLGQAYSFVGVEGVAKISSSAGNVPTPGLVLPALGPGILRWMYARSLPNRSFVIDMSPNTTRLYDEWDRLSTRVASGKASEAERTGFNRAVSTVAEPGFAANLPGEASVKMSAMASFAELTTGDRDAMRRLIDGGKGIRTVSQISAESSNNSGNSENLPEAVENLDAGIERRMNRAIAWVETFLPAEQRMRVREEFAAETFDNLSTELQETVGTLREGLPEAIENDDLTRWVFGVAKLRFGFDLDERNLTTEAKNFQKTYFTALYQLLIGRDFGPRIPDLIELMGVERALTLLGSESR